MDYTPDLAARCDFFRNLLGNLELRGLRRPVAAFNVVQSTSAADGRPNLTVVATGPGA
jgi:class 3 adenylate cyclase